MRYWIVVESLNNWNEDKKNLFNLIGFDLNKIKTRGIQDGDIFFTYISKIMKFSDCRQIISVKPIVTPITSNYDRKFEYSIKTKIIKELKEENWISLKYIENLLEFFATSSTTSIRLFSAPTEINEYDKNKIFELMRIVD
jgi:hypothetical protein